jgi:hypothetical protein
MWRRRYPRRKRWLSRIADPLLYLRAVIGVAGMMLIVVPFATDAVVAVAKPLQGSGGQPNFCSRSHMWANRMRCGAVSQYADIVLPLVDPAGGAE